VRGSASSLQTLIRSALASPAHASSVLADSLHVCRYSDIPAHLAAISTFVRDHGATDTDCITVELTNSLVSALTLLALLDDGYDVVLMPTRSRDPAAQGPQSPRFSRWLLRVAEDPARSIEPKTFLDLRLNPEHARAAPARDDRASRLYARTSGSLGMSKFVVHTHDGVAACALRVFERLQLDASFRVALPTPIFHLYGLRAAFLPALTAGASIDCQQRANLLSYLEREEEFAPNAAFMTPTFCEALLRARKAPRPYRFVVAGGDRLSDFARDTAETLHGPLINAYGSTEMGNVALGTPAMERRLRATTVGQPLPGVKWRIADGGPDGTAGELQLQSPYAFEGYVDLDGQELRFPDTYDGPWFRTRDLARAGADGTLEILGRIDLSVNRNGMLLSFAELESRLRDIHAISEAAVSAGQEGIRGRSLVAFCVLRPGDDCTPQQLRAQLAARLPWFAVPDLVSILPDLPKLESGKLDRRALETLAQRSTTNRDGGVR
jgi:acyl-coenzyme A synthetase/AMP-(fatty) acid ligase